MDETFPLFKSWVPEWLIKLILFMVIVPSLVLFFLPMANVSAAAGHYGAEPLDIQFAVAIFYAGYAGFYSLEVRFFKYLATKEYFIIFTFLQILLAFICFQTHELYVLFPFRFLQGMIFASMVNLSLSLIFSRLHSERAREIGFSVFFGMLLCAMPFNNFVTADMIDSFNFNVLYKSLIFAYLPGLLMLMTAMNNVRLNVKFPLYQLDWQSFALHSIVLVLTGYILIFGQEYYWFSDNRIRNAVITIVFLSVVYVARQRSSKRPYTNLTILKYRNFKIGAALLFVLYICRFASGLTNTFFATVLKFDPIHISYINLINMAGLIAGVVISCCLILQKKNVRNIWLSGFTLLLAFHGSMFFLFNAQANADAFFTPLFIQGLGVGLLMVPIIVFAISSVPVSVGHSAASFCLAVRYLGFCTSIAIINYFELYQKGRHYNAFQDRLSRTDPNVLNALAKQTKHLVNLGMPKIQASKEAHKLLTVNINQQSTIRFAMDYYEMMVCLIFTTLLLIALFPYLNKTIINLKSKRLSPV